MKIESLDMQQDVRKVDLKKSDRAKLENSFKLPVSFKGEDKKDTAEVRDIKNAITDPTAQGFDPEAFTYFVEDVKNAQKKPQRGIFLGFEDVKVTRENGTVADNKDILGGKGNGMFVMSNLKVLDTEEKIQVPKFFTITTDACKEYQKVYEKEYAKLFGEYKKSDDYKDLAKKNRAPKELPDEKLPQNLLSKGLLESSMKHIEVLESTTNKQFARKGIALDPNKEPLLVSVRSGAPVSMPGMMDTVLNLGMNDEVRDLIAKRTDKRFANDCYRRFLSMFGNIVLDLKDKDSKGNKTIDAFAEKLDKYKEEHKPKKYESDTDMNAEDWDIIIGQYKEYIESKIGKDKLKEILDDPEKQLSLATEAVFKSWNSSRAKAYRKEFKISDTLGTAVNVVEMAYGNKNDNSGTGVLFTRDPDTGEQGLYGEFLIKAQGEDVVAGIRKTIPISEMEHNEKLSGVYKQLKDYAKTLEDHFKDVQDIEFTIDDGKLYMLQTRNAKRSAFAQIKTAVDLHTEGLRKDIPDALKIIEANRMRERLLPIFDPVAAKDAKKLVEKALNAAPGCGKGMIIFDPNEAERLGKAGKNVILVRPETCPNDVAGMFKSQGIITLRGGKTSHAAVVAKQKGKPCVIVQDNSIVIDEEKGTLTHTDKDGKVTVLNKGQMISIDGTKGIIYEGEVPTIDPVLDNDFKTVMKWAADAKKLKTKANADTPEEAKKALELGAEGIGLCRTEHMFMQKDRLPLFRKMIMADTPEKRQTALNQLEPIQEEDFYGILKVMDNKPVTIRLVDPPLHEFLRNHDELVEEITNLRFQLINPQQIRGDIEKEIAALRAKDAEPEVIAKKEKHLKKVKIQLKNSKGISELKQEINTALKKKNATLAMVNNLREANPMLGKRGVRLILQYPEIGKMQVKAILTATAKLIKEGEENAKTGNGPVYHPWPEIMIPLVVDKNELKACREMVDETAKEVEDETGVYGIRYKFGTMIETPAACLIADELAKESDFFSFGTNDLTQTTFGFSRDDVAPLINDYLEKGILKDDPFDTIDRSRVGSLMELAVKKAKAVKPDIKIGICGEHGGEDLSVKYCDELGMNSVSASPFRIPTAVIAAAQGNIEQQKLKAKLAEEEKQKKTYGWTGFRKQA